MLKQRQEQIQFLVRFTDICVCIFAFLGAFWLRTNHPYFTPGGIGSLESVAWILAASLGIHLVAYPALGFYESIRLKTPTALATMTVKAFIIEFFILGALVFLLQEKTFSRSFFGLFLSINYSLVLIEKITARTLLSTIRRRGFNYRQVLIVGAGENARRVISALRKNQHWGYVPFGILNGTSGDTISEFSGVPIIGSVSNLERIIGNQAVDEVFFAQDRMDVIQIEKEVELCEKLGIPARFSLSLFHLPRSKAFFSTLDDIPVLTFHTTIKTPIQAFIKRVMDIGIALIGLLFTAPLFPWIAFRIRKESPGPVIFKQVRIGENGRRFKCYKFRTMILNADDKKKELYAENQMSGPIFKLDHDPRITSFGSFLRRTSLDELPQFFNILRGDMSVVGTRPPTPDEVERYENHYRRRLSIRPGLTGLWQVSGRNQIKNFEDILKLDLRYIDEWSLGLDVRIILKTIWITFSRKGAH